MIKLINEEFSSQADVKLKLKNIFQRSSCKTPEIRFLKRSITLIFSLGGVKHPKTADDTEEIFNILEENGFPVQDNYTTFGGSSRLRDWGKSDLHVSIANPLYKTKEYNDNEYDIINTLDDLCGTYGAIVAKDKTSDRFAKTRNKPMYVIPLKRTNGGYLICTMYDNRWPFRANEFESYEKYCDTIAEDVSISWLLRRIQIPPVIKSAADMRKIYNVNRSEYNPFT